MSETEVTEYKVTAARLPVVRTRFEKLAKRAAKLGVEAPTFTIVREGALFQRRDDFTGVWVTVPEAESTRVTRCYWVTVQGESPRLPGGWKLAATVQHTEVGNAIRAAAEFDATPYRTGTPKCDHCQTSRQRRDTYVVVNEAGEVKQVGSNCIANFLGGVNPEAIAAYAGSVLDAMSDLDAEAEHFSTGIRDRNSVYLPEYLAETVAAIEAHGWLSKGKASFDQTPTASVATNNMFAECRTFPACWKHNVSHRDNAEPTEAQIAEADATLTWCRDHFQDRNDLDDYEWNLSVSLLRDWIEPRETGLAASAVQYYRRNIQKAIEEAARKEQRAAAGPAPEGRVEVTGIITKIQEREGYMPGTVDYKMTVLLENGSRVWTTLPAAISQADQGDTVTFTATFERSADDETFAFGKRPSKARIIETKEA